MLSEIMYACNKENAEGIERSAHALKVMVGSLRGLARSGLAA